MSDKPTVDVTMNGTDERELAKALGLFTDAQESAGVLGEANSLQIEVWGDRLRVTARLMAFVTPAQLAVAMEKALVTK